MRLMTYIARIVAVWCATAYVATAAQGALTDAFDPPALYLTWQRDPTTTMTIHWHTLDEARTEVFSRPLGTTNWAHTTGTSAPLVGTERTVHTVELTGLNPRTDYEFCFGNGEKIFKFRTAPKDMSQPVRFITGGDVYHERPWMDTMNELAGKLDPVFIAIGGDLAYSCGKANVPEKMERWDAYFDSWKQKARAPDGRLIPKLVTIGNHEVPGSWHQPPEKAASFYTLFATPGKQGYAAIDFGHYLSLLLMDSGHTHPIEGAQTEWLEKTLSQRQSIPHIFPIYHVPAYPSYRSDTSGESADLTQAVRKFWCPLFDQNNVKIAFENHDHTYKRTHPIRGNKIDPKGIVYLGDGSWAVNVRVPDPKSPRWFIEKSGPVRHFWVVTLFEHGRHLQAINDRGEIFDELYQPTQ